MRLTTLFELTLRAGFAESLLGESSFMMVSPFVPKKPPPAPIPRFDRTEIFFLSFKWQSAGKACFLFPLLFANCRPAKANGRLCSQSSSSHSVPCITYHAMPFIRPTHCLLAANHGLPRPNYRLPAPNYRLPAPNETNLSRRIFRRET